MCKEKNLGILQNDTYLALSFENDLVRFLTSRMRAETYKRYKPVDNYREICMFIYEKKNIPSHFLKKMRFREEFAVLPHKK